MSSVFMGRKVLVLGGSSGMGLECARLVLQGGGRAVITRQRAAKTEAARAALAAMGPVHAVNTDLNDPAQVATLQAKLAAEHADVDLLFNAAGVFATKPFV